MAFSHHILSCCTSLSMELITHRVIELYWDSWRGPEARARFCIIVEFESRRVDRSPRQNARVLEFDQIHPRHEQKTALNEFRTFWHATESVETLNEVCEEWRNSMYMY